MSRRVRLLLYVLAVLAVAGTVLLIAWMEHDLWPPGDFATMPPSAIPPTTVTASQTPQQNWR